MSFTRTCATPCGIVIKRSSLLKPAVVTGAVTKVMVLSTWPAAPRYTKPALAAEEAPVDLTETEKLSDWPATTEIASLVQDGAPESRTLPPVPVIETLFDPSLPLLLQEVEPAFVFEPDHASGPEPLELDCSNDPFFTLLPWIVTLNVEALFVSFDAPTNPVRSAVPRIVCVPLTERVSQLIETVVDWPA